jgi:hypothetical protein
MNKDIKMIQNVLQCVLCISSRFHYLKHFRKGVIEKMAYLAEFCLILESNLVEHAMDRIFVESIEKCYTTYYKI